MISISIRVKIMCEWVIFLQLEIYDTLILMIELLNVILLNHDIIIGKRNDIGSLKLRYSHFKMISSVLYRDKMLFRGFHCYSINIVMSMSLAIFEDPAVVRQI